jgi:hypothetical protein
MAAIRSNGDEATVSVTYVILFCCVARILHDMEYQLWLDNISQMTWLRYRPTNVCIFLFFCFEGKILFDASSENLVKCCKGKEHP